MKIHITKSFQYAFRGHDVRTISRGEQEVPDRVAQVAQRNGWAKRPPSNKAAKSPKNKKK